MFIHCDNLVKIYKVADIEVVALQGLDLTIEEGEMLAIVGTSGSGKSTLLNVLGGLDRPSAGQVVVDGLDLLKATNTQLDRYRREKVGFVWQQTARNLVPYLTAQQNIELPMTIAGITGSEKKAWSKELLEAVGLWEFRKNKLAQLSGGQQQRVAIATSLANKPKLLLGDEPTGELDTQTAIEVLDLLRDMNARYGITIIIVTHDPETAAAVDRVVTIRDGRTSAETVRRPSDVRAVLMEGMAAATDDAQFDEFTVVDAAGRLQLPENLIETAQIGKRVTLEQTEQGILIKPVAGEASINGAQQAESDDEPAVTKRSGLRRWLGGR